MDKMKHTILLIVFYSMTSASISQAFDVKVNTETITASTGTSQTLRCRYNIRNDASRVQVNWYNYTASSPELMWDAKYTIEASSTSYSNVGPAYEGKVTGGAASSDMLSSHYITLLNIQQQDAGRYDCYVHYWQAGRYDYGSSPIITLTVHTPPQPVLTVYSHDGAGQPTSDILEGVSSYVNCESPLTVPDDNVILTIYKDSENKNCYRLSGIPGVHICRVDVIFSRSDNRAGWWCRAEWRGLAYDTRDQLVDVQFKASKVTMTQPFPLSVTEGSRVSATCKTDSANPTAVITWTQNGGVLSEGTIYTITTSEEKGMFNANISVSTLSFSATLYDNGLWFDCRLLDQDQDVYSQNSNLYVQDP